MPEPMRLPDHLSRHYRIICFAALYASYLLVLFGISEFSDLGDVGHTAERILTPLFELGLAMLLCVLFVRLHRTRGKVLWLVPPMLVAGVVGAVYLAQIYSLYLSNNFISVLTLQNGDSAAFITSPLVLIGAVAVLLWWGLFCAGVMSRRGAGPVGAERWPGRVLALALVLVCAVDAWVLTLQYKNTRLEPGFRQAPLVNLAANMYAATFGQREDTAAPPPVAGTRDCYDRPLSEAAEFPFQKAWVFKQPLPYPRVPGKHGWPNVVVIFSEGMSARLVGAYGGAHPGLTPNIDRLAGMSMRVTDYFNHTAATYRGLLGQLSSGFSLASGSGEAGWETGDNRASLGKIRRRTLPMILREHGYQSYFFSPHAASRPFTSMLDTLGFDKVFTFESIGRGLLGGDFQTRIHGTDLDDQSLFQGVLAFLRQRHQANSSKPFFIAVYNIGTHAFIGVDEHDVRYGDGSNRILNKFHNYDHAVGQFMRGLLSGPYAGNTILVFTADHATYPGTEYRQLGGNDLRPYFVDRIPLLIHDPFHRLPAAFDAQGRTSLDLAPTLLQLLDLPTARNSFLGNSLFAPRSFVEGIAALGRKFFLTTKGGVFDAASVPGELEQTFRCEVGVVGMFYRAEGENRISGTPDAGVAAAEK
jgi:phosphoglycerol transferase MdoB-like AlkP superfamily enzyme